MPKEVRDFLGIRGEFGPLHPQVKNKWVNSDYHTVDALKAEVCNCRFVKSSVDYAKGWCEIDCPAPVLPPRIKVNKPWLRAVLRSMNEGRNLKRYWMERQGSFTCTQDISPKDTSRTDISHGYILWARGKNKVEVKTAKCPRCGKRHKVTWTDVQHSAGCFDLVSFGWKDADLDPTGCTGIEKILGVQGKCVLLTVSGHKTFCDPCEDQEEEGMTDADWLAHEIVCDCGSDCEWDGDSWCASFHETIKVPVVHKDGKIDYKATARRIIRYTERVIEPYEKSWSDCQESLNHVNDEIAEAS